MSPTTPESRTSASSSYRDTMLEITNGAVTRTCREHRGLYAKKISSNKLTRSILFVLLQWYVRSMFVKVVRGAMNFTTKTTNQPFSAQRLLMHASLISFARQDPDHIPVLYHSASSFTAIIYIYKTESSNIVLYNLRLKSRILFQSKI